MKNLTIILILLVSLLFSQENRHSLVQNKSGNHKFMKCDSVIHSPLEKQASHSFSPNMQLRGVDKNDITKPFYEMNEPGFLSPENASRRRKFSDRRNNPSFPSNDYPSPWEMGSFDSHSPTQPDWTENSSGSVQLAWIRHYGSGLVFSDDIATDITVDDSGNVYITGYSLKPPNGNDYITVKYNSAGKEQWTVRYDAGDDDMAYAITIDGSGNVYVTGKTFDTVTGYDYATVKYNSSGIEQWVSRYNGTGNGWDEANALAVDDAGNVYVTGFSEGSGTEDYDYATLKYNSAGVEQWVARYDGPFNYDLASSLAVDDAGNVYVTGYSEGSGTYYDYATLKYNSAGVEQWVARYCGPVNYNNEAYSIAVDDSGNVYVTGGSYGSGTYYDYATVKYNSSGIEQWVVRYNGPGNGYDYANALAVDNAGNVYVTGYSRSSDTDYDYATVKYNPSGIEQWASRYNGPGNYNDEAYSLAVDESGNVYVTGESKGSGTNYDYATVKYNSSGIEQWALRYNGPENGYDYANALAVDDDGNVYVTGKSAISDNDYDCATVKYNSSGIEQWASRYKGAGTDRDKAKAIAIDDSGNVYIMGRSYVSGTEYDYSTVKYNSSGTEQWASLYNGPGNVYITGRSYGSGTYDDYATVKYNSSGIEQWVIRYNGPGNSFDYANALAVDNAGNVYVTGYSKGSATGDYATVKYNPSGIEQWVSRYNGPGNNTDEAYSLAVDDARNVYVTGRSEGSGTNSDYATVKYDSSGIEQWALRYNGPGNDYDKAKSLAVDNDGNVYVSGYSKGSGTDNDYATVKYNSSGIEQWVVRYNGPGNDHDYANALAIDNTGNVYVTGSSNSSATVDYTTVKYDSSGIEQWVSRYNNLGNYRNEAFALAVDDDGNVYVTGFSDDGSGTNYDYATVKYNPSGIEQWASCYNSPGNYNDYALALAIDDCDNVYVTGYTTYYNTSWSVCTTIKYTQNPVSVDDKNPDVPIKYCLNQNYPNPFNPSTRISFSLPKAAKIKIEVYNLLGQRVITLLDERKQAGSHTVEFDGSHFSSGIYFYSIHTGDFHSVKKMLLVK